mgnify:CR=1 FL=1
MGAAARNIPQLRIKPENFWTNDRVEQLKAFWDEDLTGGAIAEKLGGGISRNSVLGKAHKLNLPPRRGSARKEEPPRKRANNPLGARADRKKFASDIAELRKLKNEPVPLTDESGARLTILTAKADQCRWIAGDAAQGEICGHGVKPGASCCPHHAARARVAGTAKLAPGAKPTVWQLPGAFGRTHAL